LTLNDVYIADAKGHDDGVTLAALEALHGVHALLQELSGDLRKQLLQLGQDKCALRLMRRDHTETKANEVVVSERGGRALRRQCGRSALAQDKGKCCDHLGLAFVGL